MSKQPTIGILYPGYSAEDDFPRFEKLLDDTVALPVHHTLMNEDAHRLDALLDWGRPETLAAGAQALRDDSPDAVMWACTSGSFAYGWAGAHDQATQLASDAGIPASSTSLAFVDALRWMSITRVAIAATYPADVAALFEDFLRAAEIDVVRVSSHNIFTAAEVGTLTRDRLLDIAVAGDATDAQAVLLPDTAFHTADHLEALEARVGKPVLTANQVTVWQAVRLVEASTERAGLGALFGGQPGT